MKKTLLLLILSLTTAALYAAATYDYDFFMEKNGATGTVTGKVVDVIIHSCGPSPTRAGICNGTMRIAYDDKGVTKRMEVVISATVALRLDNQPSVVLDALLNKNVTVQHIQRADGMRHATVVTATTPR